MSLQTFLVLTIIVTSQSACPPIETMKIIPSKGCTFYFSESSASSCSFSNCSNPSNVTSNDWSDCIQNCCKNMTPPLNVDPSGVQQCMDYINFTSKGASLGTREILIIIAINIGGVILIILSIKIFGNCCCDPESACHFDKLCRCCFNSINNYFAQNSFDAIMARPTASIQNIVETHQSIPANRVQTKEWILDGWETDDIALKRNLCSICLDDTSNTFLDCGHWFHYQCIGRWAKSKKECPNCKKQGLKNIKVYCGQCLSKWQLNKYVVLVNRKIICQSCKSIQQ